MLKYMTAPKFNNIKCWTLFIAGACFGVQNYLAMLLVILAGAALDIVLTAVAAGRWPNVAAEFRGLKDDLARIWRTKP